MIQIAWLVEREDVQVLCSTPEKVDIIIRTILQDGGCKIADTLNYEHIRLSLSNINVSRESYVDLKCDIISTDAPEPIKITRMQLL